MNQADLDALKAPLLILMIVVLASSAAIYYTDRLTRFAAQQLARQEAQLRDARIRVQKSGEEKDIIVRYLDRYRALQRAGFIGEEQRINWLDGLRIANQQAGLFGVDYQIGPQSAYPYAGSLDPGQIMLHRSMMRLQMRLLHEGDLFRFLTALERQESGIFYVDRCVLRRIGDAAATQYQPNLSAECELSWITANVRSPAGGGKP